MDLLAELEDAIGGPGTFDRDVYETEAKRAMEAFARWLRREPHTDKDGWNLSPKELADELDAMAKS